MRARSSSNSKAKDKTVGNRSSASNKKKEESSPEDFYIMQSIMKKKRKNLQFNRNIQLKKAVHEFYVQYDKAGVRSHFEEAFLLLFLKLKNWQHIEYREYILDIFVPNAWNACPYSENIQQEKNKRKMYFQYLQRIRAASMTESEASCLRAMGRVRINRQATDGRAFIKIAQAFGSEIQRIIKEAAETDSPTH